MGLGSSKVNTVYKSISNWEWSRTIAVIKAYHDEEHDFGIDINIISSLTALNIEESKLLMKSLAKSDSGVINAITMLIAIICISDVNRSDIIDLKLEALFDLVDFSNSGTINMDELTLLFYCIGSALSAILQQQSTCPNENLISKLVHVLRDELHKEHSSNLSKSEFISWSKRKIDLVVNNNITLQNIYEKIFLSPSVGSGNNINNNSASSGNSTTSDKGNNQKQGDDNATIDEGSYTLAAPSIDSLHPDYKDDETIGTKEHANEDQEDPDG